MLTTPSRIEFRHFWTWEQIVGGRTPRTDILKGLFRQIYIEKGPIKCFNFSFLRLGLRLTYNSDIFEKLRPPPIGFQMSEFEFQTFLFCFFIPPPPIWNIVPKFSRFWIMLPPLTSFFRGPRRKKVGDKDAPYPYMTTRIFVFDI